MNNYKFSNAMECNGLGKYSLCMGPISQNIQSSVYAEVCHGPGTIEFKWKKQSSLAALEFLINDTTVGRCDLISTDKMETWGPYRLNAGLHKLSWHYGFDNAKPTDAAIRSSAWIDDIHLSNLGIFNPGEEYEDKYTEPTIKPTDDLVDIGGILNASTNRINILQGTDLQMVFDAAKMLKVKYQFFNKTYILKGDNFEGNISIKKIKDIRIEYESDNPYLLNKNKLDGKWRAFNILLENSSNVSIVGLHLTNSLTGIQMENCTDCKILNNKIQVFSNNLNCCIGILMWNCSNCEISNNYLRSNEANVCRSSKGIWQINSSNNILENNDFRGFEKYYYIEENSSNNKIFDSNEEIARENSFEEENCNEWWPYE